MQQTELARKVLNQVRTHNSQKVERDGDSLFVQSGISNIKVGKDNELAITFDAGCMSNHAAMQALSLEKQFGNVQISTEMYG